MVTVVSHAGIANRIKNLLSAISQHGDVSTLHDTISFIFPSIKKVDEVEEEYPEDWRLYVCLLYTSPSPRDVEESRMPSSA